MAAFGMAQVGCVGDGAKQFLSRDGGSCACGMCRGRWAPSMDCVIKHHRGVL